MLPENSQEAFGVRQPAEKVRREHAVERLAGNQRAGLQVAGVALGELTALHQTPAWNFRNAALHNLTGDEGFVNLMAL